MTKHADEVQFLVNENRKMRRAGCELAAAALYVAREYDGIHRLLLATSKWTRVLADEGCRGKIAEDDKTEQIGR